jgi:transcriptional regulator with XRE-family HTH domain
MEQKKSSEYKVRIDLLLAIKNAGMYQYEVGEKAGIHDSRMSMIVTGRKEPSDDEKIRIAYVLHKTVEQLFPSSVAS